MAYETKHQSAKREGVSIDASGERELLIKAVRVNTLSKLTYDDTRQFLALIGDVFPGAESSDIPGVSEGTNIKSLHNDVIAPLL